MKLVEEIRRIPNGASFQRIDLHIHSYGEDGSPCVHDARLTPKAIVDSASQRSISAISITDHNRIANVQKALQAAEGTDVLLIPGVELSTIQGHLLVYFKELDQLAKFYGKLNFNKDWTACRNTIPDCLRLAAEFDGFAVAAHIDSDAGFESTIKGYGEAKRMIVVDPQLCAIEVVNSRDADWFSTLDRNQARRGLFVERCSELQTHTDYRWPTVMFSDAHSLEAFENAADRGGITRLKMDSPSFDAVRIAFSDPLSHVRTEELIPQRFPRIVGIQTSGGFLGDQTIHLNRNLNTIIGGRGAGKSTLLESLREGVGVTSTASLVDSDVWPDLISVAYEDETGRVHLFERRRGSGELRCTTSGDFRLEAVPLESYSQGETSLLIKRCREEPLQLLKFLDQFTGVRELLEKDTDICDLLKTNSQDISALENVFELLRKATARFNEVQEKIDTLRAENAGELMELEQALAEGTSFRSSVISDLNSLFQNISSSLGKRDIAQALLALQPTALVVGKAELSRIKTIITEVQGAIDKLSSTWKESATSYVGAIRSELDKWKELEKELEERIAEKRQELAKKGITLKASYVRDLASKAADYRVQIHDLNQKKERLLALRIRRSELVRERREIRARITAKRIAWATRITKSLRGTVSGYEISVKFRNRRVSPETADLLKKACEWRTSQVPRAHLISSHYSPFELINIVRYKRHDALSALMTDTDNRALSDEDIQLLIARLSHPALIRELERIPYDDLPEISVAKLTNEDGETKALVRDFTRLSLGQQQAVLLSILLFSDSHLPLVIDQPEDNLDNEFIYRTVVGNLKRVKEHRQVIVVTHNANLAVLGDSELIIPLKATSDKTYVVNSGSIDAAETRGTTCDILEGNEEAFRRRQTVYGLGTT